MLRNISLKLIPFVRCARLTTNTDLFVKNQLPYSSVAGSFHNKIYRCSKSLDITSLRSFCDASKNKDKDLNTSNVQSVDQKSDDTLNIQTAKVNIFRRVILTIQSYGIVFVVMVIVTGAMWFSLCLLAAYQGLNIIPLLTLLHAPKWIVDTLSTPGVGEIATAYVFYKILSPIRYYVTYKSTKIISKKLQDLGYLSRVSEENRLRNLAKEGGQLSRQFIASKTKDYGKKWK